MSECLNCACENSPDVLGVIALISLIIFMNAMALCVCAAVWSMWLEAKR